MANPRRTFGAVDELPSGKFRARYKKRGRTVTHTFAKRKQAEDWLSTVNASIIQGTWIADPAMTFGDWFERRVESAGRKASTNARYKTYGRVHFLPVLGDRLLKTISPLDIDELVETWRTSGKHQRDGTPTGEPLAANSVNVLYRTLASVFNAAVRYDMIPRNPCRVVKLPVVDDREIPELDVDDLQDLAEALGERWGLMVWLAAILGLRIGETVALRVSDFDFLSRELTVSRIHNYVEGKLLVTAPKSRASNRRMQVPEPMLDMLSAHIKRWELGPDDLLFTSERGMPLRADHWSNHFWARARESIGQPELHFHDLRKLSAALMVDAGIHPKVIQERLGHADPRITMKVYAKRTEKADADAAQRLGKVMTPSDTRRKSRKYVQNRGSNERSHLRGL
jgi:integrase